VIVYIVSHSLYPISADREPDELLLADAMNRRCAALKIVESPSNSSALRRTEHAQISGTKLLQTLKLVVLKY
jgi:hypothetical protein